LRCIFGLGGGRKDGYGCREVKGILYTRWKTSWELELGHCVGVLESGVNGSARIVPSLLGVKVGNGIGTRIA